MHPQSIVHSLVEFVDGSSIAQAQPADMRLPIALGLAWPDRVPGAIAPLDWTAATRWDFEPVDHEVFPARSGWPGGPGAPAGLPRRSSTPPTRSPSSGSWTVGSATCRSPNWSLLSSDDHLASRRISAEPRGSGCVRVLSADATPVRGPHHGSEGGHG